jgi:hypothetical protein
MVGGLQCPPCRALAGFATPGRSQSAPQRAEPALRTRTASAGVSVTSARAKVRQPTWSSHSRRRGAGSHSFATPSPVPQISDQGANHVPVAQWFAGGRKVCTLRRFAPPPRFAPRPRFAPLTRFAGSLVCSVVRCTEPCLDPPEVRSARSRSNPAQAAPNLVCRRLSSGLPTALPTAFVYSFQRVGGTDFGQAHHPDTGSGAILAVNRRRVPPPA